MDLTQLNGRWWDREVDSWDGCRLVATFSHPVFRPPSAEERRRVAESLGAGAWQLSAWDAEASGDSFTGLVAARSVTVAEGLAKHAG